MTRSMTVPMAREQDRDAQAAPRAMALLGISERGGRDEIPEIEGTIPPDLRGSLYRNGPGLFERGGLRKPHLLDGDGLVQRLSFADGTARYQNAFVRTPKFIAEEQAGRYRFATWSMRRPGGLVANLGGGSAHSQAGVTVYPFNDLLYAFDEVSPAFGLDPETLETLGEQTLGDPGKEFMIKAHTKFDPITGEWLLFGVSHGPSMKLHAVIRGADGALKAHHVVTSPRQVYIHDFFATREHLIFVLHPMWFSPWRFLSGQASFIEALSWRPGDGNQVMVVPRGGGAPQLFEAAAAFIWHALNAYGDGHEIVADFVGYDSPDHFAPHGALLYKLMQGQMGVARAPGTLRRYRIDLAARSLHEEILDPGTHEFPMIDPRAAMQKHEVAYLSAGGRNVVNSGIKRVDYCNRKAQFFDFGPDAVAGEPVFAARPGGKRDEGWLIVQCLDGRSEQAFFALFDAAHVDAGPIARIRLPHALPISFHGAWKAA
jgi:all-trans-8'-apo-beta-carotenal 15,15'-oxygenase